MGLIIIVLSRDKEEDELTIYLRLTAMLDMFVFAVIYVIIKPLIVLMFQTTFIDITGQQLVTLMLIGYLISYYLKRYNR